jgi:hypothetical protein
MEILEHASQEVTVSTFHISPNALFTKQPIIQHYILWVPENVFEDSCYIGFDVM